MFAIFAIHFGCFYILFPMFFEHSIWATLSFQGWTKEASPRLVACAPCLGKSTVDPPNMTQMSVNDIYIYIYCKYIMNYNGFLENCHSSVVQVEVVHIVIRDLRLKKKKHSPVKKVHSIHKCCYTNFCHNILFLNGFEFMKCNMDLVDCTNTYKLLSLAPCHLGLTLQNWGWMGWV